MEITFVMTDKGKRYASPMRAIKAQCFECSAGVPSEVKLCTVKNCPLYAYRLGKNPFRAEKSPEMKAKAAKSMKRRMANGKL